MSRSTEGPITPSVLRWAIAQSAYGLDELASAANVSSPQTEQWLAGKNVPNLTQARKLATKLHRPLAALLLPAPPKSWARSATNIG